MLLSPSRLKWAALSERNEEGPVYEACFLEQDCLECHVVFEWKCPAAYNTSKAVTERYTQKAIIEITE